MHPVKSMETATPIPVIHSSPTSANSPELQQLTTPVEIRIHLHGELGLYHGIGKRGRKPRRRNHRRCRGIKLNYMTGT